MKILTKTITKTSNSVGSVADKPFTLKIGNNSYLESNNIIEMPQTVNSITLNETTYTPNDAGNIDLGTIQSQIEVIPSGDGNGVSSVVYENNALTVTSDWFVKGVNDGKSTYLPNNEGIVELNYADWLDSLLENVDDLYKSRLVNIKTKLTGSPYKLVSSISSEVTSHTATITLDRDGNIPITSVYWQANDSYSYPNDDGVYVIDETKWFTSIVLNGVKFNNQTFEKGDDFYVTIPYTVWSRDSKGDIGNSSVFLDSSKLVSCKGLTFWDGSYQSGQSNLTYCYKGAFGDAAIKGVLATTGYGYDQLTSNDTSNVVSVATLKSVEEYNLHCFSRNANNCWVDGGGSKWVHLWRQPCRSDWNALYFAMYVTENVSNQRYFMTYRGRRLSGTNYTDSGLTVYCMSGSTNPVKYCVWYDNDSSSSTYRQMFIDVFILRNFQDYMVYNITPIQTSVFDNLNYVSTAKIDNCCIIETIDAPYVSGQQIVGLTDAVRIYSITGVKVNSVTYSPDLYGVIDLGSISGVGAASVVIVNGNYYSVNSSGLINIGTGYVKKGDFVHALPFGYVPRPCNFAVSSLVSIPTTGTKRLSVYISLHLLRSGTSKVDGDGNSVQNASTLDNAFFELYFCRNHNYPNNSIGFLLFQVSYDRAVNIINTTLLTGTFDRYVGNNGVLIDINFDTYAFPVRIDSDAPFAVQSNQTIDNWNTTTTRSLVADNLLYQSETITENTVVNTRVQGNADLIQCDTNFVA